MAELIEMENGDFVAIGVLAPPEIEVPDRYTAHVENGEEAVIIPRRYVINAAREILRNEDIN